MLTVAYKRRNRFSQVDISFGCGIIGEVFSVSVDDLFFERFGNRENSGVEIANSKIINLFALPYFFADVAAQLNDFRSDKCFREV